MLQEKAFGYALTDYENHWFESRIQVENLLCLSVSPADNNTTADILTLHFHTTVSRTKPRIALIHSAQILMHAASRFSQISAVSQSSIATAPAVSLQPQLPFFRTIVAELFV